MKALSSLFSSKGAYSTEKENEYYHKSKVDRSAVDYRHLDKYIAGSIGLDFFRGKSVLDVGAGEGVYSAWIADRGGAKRVVGLELTEHRIRREYEQKLVNLKFVCGDIFNSEFGKGNEQFDVVFMNLVLHHLGFDLDRAIQIMAESLRPGGVFVAFEPNCYSPFAVIAHILHARSANEDFLLPYRLKAILSTAGFSEIKMGYFWRDRQWAKNPILASSFWIIAKKEAT